MEKVKLIRESSKNKRGSSLITDGWLIGVREGAYLGNDMTIHFFQTARELKNSVKTILSTTLFGKAYMREFIGPMTDQQLKVLCCKFQNDIINKVI